ncbi:hypothetical protein BJB45_05110 [Halomonas huangheensis]|uniref:Uncharacterized protein n=1 Tax=Halomonas huangheensis TaxID=1178482 RepID=W1N4Q5_9GAMM|nr:hypothetical protein BJB45_05110 [Halomonas huangheensis]
MAAIEMELRIEEFLIVVLVSAYIAIVVGLPWRLNAPAGINLSSKLLSCWIG